MTHVTCMLAAKNRDQLRNSTLGNRVCATFTLHALTLVCSVTVLAATRRAVLQDKHQMEADVADARRTTAKLKQRLSAVRASSDVEQRRMLTVLGVQQADMSTTPRFNGSTSAAGDCSGHSSADDAPALQHLQQVTLGQLSPRRETGTSQCAAMLCG